MSDEQPQRFQLRTEGRDYLLVVHPGFQRRLVLLRDGRQIAEKKTVDDRADVRTKGGGVRVAVRMTMLGRVRRATLHVGDRQLDLDPEPGSKAARRLDRERERPVLYGALDVLVAAAGVVLPLLGIGAFLKLLLEPILRWLRSLLPDVDLPTAPLPDISLPSIPRPSIDLPDIPWPDWAAPAWLAWAAQHAKYVWPIVLAALFAWYEVARRRKQDAIKAELAAKERQALLSRLAVDLRQVEQTRRR